MKNPNFLILDEPTNDLDIFTLQVLEDYLLSFEGCLIIVSHDRYFMDKLVDHIFLLNGDGTIKDIVGNYNEYRDYREEQIVEKRKEKAIETERVKNNSGKTRQLSFNEKKEFEKLDSEIPVLETQRNKLSEELTSGKLSYDEIEKISAQLITLSAEIDSKSERWMELASLV
jgi:ATP-binding cassette subfamily F protein uup